MISEEELQFSRKYISTKAQDHRAIFPVGGQCQQRMTENEERTRLRRGKAFLSMLTLDQEQIGWMFTHLIYFLSTYYVPCTKLSKTSPVLPASLSLAQELPFLLRNKAISESHRVAVITCSETVPCRPVHFEGIVLLMQKPNLRACSCPSAYRRDMWHIRGSSSPKPVVSSDFW